MSRRKEPTIPNDLLDQLLAGGAASAAFEQGGLLTQEYIGDATGLTAEHVNRMIRTLREDGALRRTGRRLQIADWQKMRRIAGFQPDYLHLAA